MSEAEWLECTDPGPMLDFLRGMASERKMKLFGVACIRHIVHLFLLQEERILFQKTEQYAEGQISKDDLTRTAVDVLYRGPLSDAQEALFSLAGVPSNCVTGWLPSGYDLWPVFKPEDQKLSHLSTARRAEQYVAWAIAREKDKIGVEEALDQACDLVKDVAPSSDLEDQLRETAKATGSSASWKSAYHSAEKYHCNILRDLIGPTPFRPITFNTSWLTPQVIVLAQEIYDTRAFNRLPDLAHALEDAGCTHPAILEHCRGPGPHERGCWVLDLVLGKG